MEIGRVINLANFTFNFYLFTFEIIPMNMQQKPDSIERLICLYILFLDSQYTLGRCIPKGNYLRTVI